ncbi:MAG: phage tail protein [Enterocloster aldenensis]|uniref:phage tail-collar fiber domain-containing protein n=1 Tax=Enterocloster sp. TaxID=2719315 RepID=UPI0039A3E04A
MAGTVLTNKGLALITKLMAAQATLSFSRVAVGTGRVPSGYDAQNMTGLNEYKMDATIESCGVSTEQSDVAYIVTQISSVGVSTGFAITEAGVFATDPDDGEILYAYLDLTQDPQYIYASTDAISKFAEITFNVLVGSVTSVTAIVSPGALVKKSEFDNLKTRVEDVETPEFDASGTAEGITDKTSLLASFVTKMPLVKFMRNVVAGFKLVLYSGQIVNNCVTDRPDLPGSAAQLKVLMDLYTVLNTNLSSKAGYGDNTYRGKQHVITYAGIGDRAYLNMQFVSEAPWSENNATRAGYGFHNSGSNGGALYLDTDGRLKFVASDTNTVYALDWHSL